MYEDIPDNLCLWRTRRKGGHTVYYNLITNQETKIKPVESRGGILADDVAHLLLWYSNGTDGSGKDDKLSSAYLCHPPRRTNLRPRKSNRSQTQQRRKSDRTRHPLKMRNNNPHHSSPFHCLKLGRTIVNAHQTRHSLNIYLPRRQQRRKYQSSRRVRLYRHHLLDTLTGLYASEKEYG